MVKVDQQIATGTVFEPNYELTWSIVLTHTGETRTSVFSCLVSGWKVTWLYSNYVHQQLLKLKSSFSTQKMKTWLLILFILSHFSQAKVRYAIESFILFYCICKVRSELLDTGLVSYLDIIPTISGNTTTTCNSFNNSWNTFNWAEHHQCMK